MLDLLRDSLWQGVGAGLSLIGTLVTLWAFYVQRSTKALSFSHFSYPVFAIADQSLATKITVMHQNRQVDRLSILWLDFSCNGKLSILRSDFERPISVTVDSSVTLLEAQSVKRRSTDQIASLNCESGRCEIAPMLLNSGDTLSIKLLIEGDTSKSSFVVDSKIVGVRDITSKGHKGLTVFWPYLTVQSVSIVMLLIAEFESSRIFPNWFKISLVGIGLLCSAYIFLRIHLRNKALNSAIRGGMIDDSPL